MRLIVAALCCAIPAGLHAQAVAQGRPADPGTVQFTVRIENVSAKALKLTGGGSSDINLSGVAWAVHRGGNPFFTPGEVEPGLGLKAFAEAGQPERLLQSLDKARSPDIGALGVQAVPVGSEGPDILSPGGVFEFTCSAKPGDRLSLVMMLGESNDGLIATGSTPIELFRGQRPLSGDVTARMGLWDAGTEVNEEPGVGRNIGMKQGAPHAGDPERRPVRPMSEAEHGKVWPAASRIVRVTVTPKP